MANAPTEDELDTCWHEAGHVVMYRLFGVRVLSSELLGPLHGLTEPAPGTEGTTPREKLEFGSIEILVTLAGTAANTLMRSGRARDQGDDNDLNRAREEAEKTYHRSMYNKEDFFGGLQTLTITLLARHKDLIAKVADALWKAKKLDEAAINILVPPGLCAKADLEAWLDDWHKTA
jgi:hypothetical protein